MTTPALRPLETVPSTKLHPPRPPRHLMAREALVQRLMQARNRRCIVLEGPAGSGKTSLVAAWRQALVTHDVDVGWLSLIGDDDEPQRFCACVLASLARIDPDLVQPAAQLLEREDDADADELWVITLVQTLSTRRRDIVLVLDDVQHMTHPRIGRILHWLLDYAPPCLHVTLVTRKEVPLELQRWRAQGQLAEFDVNDLRFTPEESARFLREEIGGIAAHEVARLHEITDGWVAGLKLLAIDRKANHEPSEGTGRVRDAQAFAGYFEREVLHRLPPEDLELLMYGAICHRFCASLCAALLQQPDPEAVGRRLSQLQRADLFVSRVSAEGHEAWYRLHPLMREVLLQRLTSRIGREMQWLHGVAWRWFDACGAIDEAVRHAVLAGEPEAGADLIEANARDVAARSGMAQLGVLIRRLPPQLVKRRFGLRLMMAHLSLAAHKLAIVESDLAEMEKEVARADDAPPWQRRGLVVLRAGLAMQRDDTDAIATMCEELEAIPDNADPFDVARRGEALAWLHMNQGLYEKAREALDAAQRTGLSDERQLVGEAFRGMSLTAEGRLGDAETLLRKVLERAELQHSVDGAMVCVAAGLLSDPLYEGNGLTAVRDLLEPRVELFERCVIPDILLRSMIVLSSTHWTLGHRLEALAVAQRLEDYALRHRLDRVLAHALLLQLRWQLREGQVDAASEPLQRIESLGERHAHAAAGTFSQVARLAGRARAAMCLHWNDFGRAREHLLQVLASAQATQRWREVVMARMQLVVTAKGAGQDDEAWGQLNEALRMGHRMGLMRTLLDTSPGVPGLLRQWQAQFGGDADPVLAFYVGRLLSGAAQVRELARPRRDAPAQGAEQVTLSERESAVLALVAQAMPNKKIARALDVTPHTVKFHLRNIYLKLGVSERDQALARWRDLQAGDSPGHLGTSTSRTG